MQSNDSTALQVLNEIFKDIEIAVTYSSLYEENWQSLFGRDAALKPVELN
ncbi:MAG: hypothetical protein M3512_03775 [Bacteroidota bacterium]|nr:hypothetical protein [Bacteroidota bacterium]